MVIQRKESENEISSQALGGGSECEYEEKKQKAEGSEDDAASAQISLKQSTARINAFEPLSSGVVSITQQLAYQGSESVAEGAGKRQCDAM